MKNILCLSICLLLCLFSDAQNQIINGEVIDATTQQRIPYVSILLRTQQNSTTTNAKGFFRLEIPANAEKDTLFFSCLNYQKANITIQEFLLKKGKITLIPISYELSEVVVRGNPLRTEKLGVFTKKCNTNFLESVGHQIGVHIYDAEKRPLKLKQIGIFITNWGRVDTPFKLRIYSLDKDTMPEKDLLKENLVIQAKKKGWFWYDVSKYNIYVPAEGVVVAFEQIFTDIKYYWVDRYYVKGKKKPIEKLKYGLTIGLSDKIQGNYTFSKQSTWYKYTGFRPNNNAMIAAEVDFYE